MTMNKLTLLAATAAVILTGTSWSPSRTPSWSAANDTDCGVFQLARVNRRVVGDAVAVGKYQSVVPTSRGARL